MFAEGRFALPEDTSAAITQVREECLTVSDSHRRTD